MNDNAAKVVVRSAMGDDDMVLAKLGYKSEFKREFSVCEIH